MPAPLPTTGAIVLAAGKSRRMGTQKLLLPFAGRTMIGHVVAQVVASPVRHAVVVVGADRAAVSAAVAGPGVAVVTNEDISGDMLSSIRCGLRALPAECDAVLVVLGDQPSVTPDLIARLTAAYAVGRGRIIVPAYDGRRGHPLLFAAAFREEVLAGYDDLGLRGLLQAHERDVLEVPVADDGVVSDVDVPDDYRRALEKSAPSSSPSGVTET